MMHVTWRRSQTLNYYTLCYFSIFREYLTQGNAQNCDTSDNGCVEVESNRRLLLRNSVATKRKGSYQWMSLGRACTALQVHCKKWADAPLICMPVHGQLVHDINNYSSIGWQFGGVMNSCFLLHSTRVNQGQLPYLSLSFLICVV